MDITIYILPPDNNNRCWLKRARSRHYGSRCPSNYCSLHLTNVPVLYSSEKESIIKLNENMHAKFVDPDLSDDDINKVVVQQRIFLNPDLLPDPYKTELFSGSRMTECDFSIAFASTRVITPHEDNIHDPFLWQLSPPTLDNL